MKRFNRVVLGLGMSLGVAFPASAATATATMTISAAVAGACSVTASPISFGTSIPNAIASNIDAQGAITAACAAGTPYTIRLNAGIGAGATLASRRMRAQGTTSTMAYSLYTDPARTALWGDGTSASAIFSNTANGANQQIPVYGRIPAGQTVVNGNYFDTVTVTVTF